ncbi:MAG TPA: DOMON-like domain-containing protein [Sphingomonas sp.]|nr:DOMON-like domain-containing protein [Sphingomonas sp.]
MTALSLLPHPDFSGVAVKAISVMAERIAADSLTLRYVVTGAIADIAWPAPAVRIFTDELWRHSCLEAFVAREGGIGYREINLAPSGAWAAYAFDGYRAGMHRADIATPTGFMWREEGDTAELTATLAIPTFADDPLWRLGLTAVIEEKSGAKSYWALAHPPGQPDFHNAHCFTARLAAPERA